MAQKAAEKKHPIKSIITLAAMASSGYDTLNRQLSNQSEFVSQSALPLLARLAKGEDIPVEDVPPFLLNLFHPNLQGFLKSFLHIDPTAELSKVRQPVLVIIGETDIQITVEETEKMVSDAKHALLVKIPEMNHVLKVAPIEYIANMATYSQPELPLHKDLMPTILKFLSK